MSSSTKASTNTCLIYHMYLVILYLYEENHVDDCKDFVLVSSTLISLNL